MGIRFSNPKLLIITFSIVMTGCAKKDRNCNCTVNGDDYNTTITNSTKSQAGQKCGNYGKQIGSSHSNTYVYKCKVN